MCTTAMNTAEKKNERLQIALIKDLKHQRDSLQRGGKWFCKWLQQGRAFKLNKGVKTALHGVQVQHCKSHPIPFSGNAGFRPPGAHRASRCSQLEPGTARPRPGARCRRCWPCGPRCVHGPAPRQQQPGSASGCQAAGLGLLSCLRAQPRPSPPPARASPASGRAAASPAGGRREPPPPPPPPPLPPPPARASAPSGSSRLASRSPAPRRKPARPRPPPTLLAAANGPRRRAAAHALWRWRTEPAPPPSRVASATPAPRCSICTCHVGAAGRVLSQGLSDSPGEGRMCQRLRP